MTKVKGIDILVGIKGATVYTTLGGQRNATLNRSSETIEVTDKVSGGWKENLAGFKEWSIDCDGLYVVSDAAYLVLETAFSAGTAVDVEISDGTNIHFSGKAYITDFPIEAPYDDAATYSLSLQGTGALAATEGV